MGKAKAKNTVGRKKGAGTGLNDWFIVIFGVAFVLSFSLNVMHLTMDNSDDVSDKERRATNEEAARSALRRAMKGFQQQSIVAKNKGRKKTNIGDLKKKESGIVNVAKTKKAESSGGGSPLGTLQCNAHGGPSPEAAQEMVYWREIHSDSAYSPPFFDMNRKPGKEKMYMTFEPDGGGWNNIRMAMEATIAMAIATGRTLVMPPQKNMYLLGKNEKGQKHHFSFVDFFPIEQMARDNKAFEVVSMKEYLEAEAMTGKLISKETGQVEFPPGNRTDWEIINQGEYDELRYYLRRVSHTLDWKADKCLPAFPSSGDHKDVQILQGLVGKTKKIDSSKLFKVDDPNPVYRLAESLKGRGKLCVYDEQDQNEKVVHFEMNHKKGLRLLVHFYGFLFFEDWREDMWMKRMVRDHLYYKEDIQCAAARVVEKVREHALKTSGGKSKEFDSFHIRRGDFQFKDTRIGIDEIMKNTKARLTPGSTIFVATDERDKNFFKPLKELYDVLFLDDFKHELKGVNSNYFGMIDQLVSSRGRIFFGCWHSTFTSYIMRLRGYHSIKDKAPGYEKGTLPTTFYYTPMAKQEEMGKFAPIDGAFFNREFPASWRDIDTGIRELTSSI